MEIMLVLRKNGCSVGKTGISLLKPPRKEPNPAGWPDSPAATRLSPPVSLEVSGAY